MKLTTKVLGVATVLCLLAVAAVPASAAFEKAGNGQGPLGLLDEIEAAGYDVTDIRTAFENEDFENARTLMHQFMEAHQGEFAPAHGGNNPGRGMGNAGMLDNLEEQGYDVTDIRTAFENGDTETGRTLMHQFMEAHHGEFAPPHDGDRPGMGGAGMLDNLEEQGYDVTDIRTAFEDGDTETGRTLMHQFMEEHQGEFAPPHDGEKSGMGMRGNGGMNHGCRANA